MSQPKEKLKTPEELKKLWERRHLDPKMRSKWVAEIEVIQPADSTKGKTHGIRKYPDGTLEAFEVERR